jgi:hypothetical protein
MFSSPRRRSFSSARSCASAFARSAAWVWVLDRDPVRAHQLRVALFELAVRLL